MHLIIWILFMMLLFTAFIPGLGFLLAGFIKLSLLWIGANTVCKLVFGRSLMELLTDDFI